jgi:hypothetical protein
MEERSLYRPGLALLCGPGPVAQWIEQRVLPLSEGALALLSGSSAAAVRDRGSRWQALAGMGGKRRERVEVAGLPLRSVAARAFE